jgi:hypothetical protein
MTMKLSVPAVVYLDWHWILILVLLTLVFTKKSMQSCYFKKKMHEKADEKHGKRKWQGLEEKRK